MLAEEKKILLLLNLIIFNYHGLDENERLLLKNLSEKLDAEEELKWAYGMLGEDYFSSFESINDWFKEAVKDFDPDKKLSFLQMVWEATVAKGFISEMEATAMLKIARNWGIQKELLSLVRKK
ncbi:MAG: hypothetical protein H7259_04055 [Cytophagales bacterium]|nr:hypothetical protein [Cytophaga sp.]